MSNFLDELKENNGCSYSDGTYVLDEMIDSLGENARKMLEIGIVQDELVKLRFYFKNGLAEEPINYMMYSLKFWKQYIRIEFGLNNIAITCDYIGYCEFYYTSPTWQEDVINKVKELIK